MLKVNDYKKYGILGGVVGVGLPVFLKTVSSLVSMIPGIALNLQSTIAVPSGTAAQPILSISTSGLTTAVNTGLGAKIGEFASKVLSISPIPISGLEWVWAAVGGAAFFIAGAFVADKLGLLTGSKMKQVATAGILGGTFVGSFMAWSLSIPTFGTILANIITWTILSAIIVKTDEKLLDNKLLG